MDAFRYCSSLISVTIPNFVTSIEPYVFYGCTSLVSITIPELVKTVCFSAFEGCKSLQNIFSYAITPPVVNYYGFYDFPFDAVLNVPEGAMDAYLIADGWKYFKDIREMTSDVDELSSDGNANPKDIYNMQGTLVKANASQADIDALEPGIYIIGGCKVIVK